MKILQLSMELNILIEMNLMNLKNTLMPRKQTKVRVCR